MEVGGPGEGASGKSVSSSGGLHLVAAGLSAHGQIREGGSKDIRSFVPISGSDGAGKGARVIFAGWSSTAIIDDSGIRGEGHQNFSCSLAPETTNKLIDGFGDHNGMLGCLDTEGNVYLISEANEFICHSTESSPKIGHIALAGNEKLAISFKQAPNGRLCHILQFESLDEFKTWFKDPSGVQIDPEKQHFMVQGRPIQLVAGIGTFMVLMEGGEVYTWGDPRYQSLGRSIADVPAFRPGLVEALGGLKVSKVAAGGWMNAALTEDRAAYVWGAGMPGTDKTIKLLQEAGAGEVALVSISSSRDGDVEPLDIMDVGVGDNHIAIVTDGGRLFIVGNNKNGQLGLSSDEAWVDEWTDAPRVANKSNFRGIVCGPQATFASVATTSHHP